MWMPPVSDVSEERGQCGATCWKRGAPRGAEGGHCEVTVDSAQKTQTANQDTGSTFSPTRSKCPRLSPCGEAPPPSEDELFWHKCLELQRYVRPLESILQRLRSGRFSQRLSSLQQGVAVERIQRIMATLQNPNKGRSFLTNIQKLEGMLKSWFPHVSDADDHVLAKRQKEVTQVNDVSSSSDRRLRKRGRRPLDSPFRPGIQGSPPFSVTSPCLQRLLQARESIVTPPVWGGCNSQDV